MNVERRCKEWFKFLTEKLITLKIDNVIKANSNIIAAIVMPIKELETGDFVPSAAIIYRPQSKDAMRSMKDKLIKEFNITIERERELLGYMYVLHLILSLKEFSTFDLVSSILAGVLTLESVFFINIL